MATKLPEEEYRDIYAKAPRLAVELLVKNEEGILLVKRDIPPGIGLWYLPGGTVLFDESVEEAVQRIGQEELGVEVSIIKFLRFTDWYQSKNSTGHSVSLVFEVKIDQGEIKLDFQSSEFGYFKKLPEDTMKEYQYLNSIDPSYAIL